MKTKKSLFLFLLILTVFFYGCKTTSELTESDNLPDGYQLFQGETADKKVTWHCIKIDLDTPNLELLLLPETEDYESFFLYKTASKLNATVAINTTPFNMNNNKLIGITKTNNQEITPPAEQYAALCFSETPLRAHIINSQSSEELEKYTAAAGGFFTILEGNTIYAFANIKRSRSGAGISQDGRFLYLFATTPKFNLRDADGMTYEECALLLQELGCYSALQFDGGHSTGLFFNNQKLETPLFQRKVPACLIIK